MYTTSYVKASDVADAAAKLGVADDGKLLAGGQTLLPTLKQRLANPDQLIDLAGCSLSGVSKSGDAIKIGAMTCHADVSKHKDVATSNPGLAQLAGWHYRSPSCSFSQVLALACFFFIRGCPQLEDL